MLILNASCQSCGKAFGQNEPVNDVQAMDKSGVPKKMRMCDPCFVKTTLINIMIVIGQVSSEIAELLERKNNQPSAFSGIYEPKKEGDKNGK